MPIPKSSIFKFLNFLFNFFDSSEAGIAKGDLIDLNDLASANNLSGLHAT